VTLVDGKRGGTVKFVGETVYGPGVWLGIELEKPTGKGEWSLSTRAFSSWRRFGDARWLTSVHYMSRSA